MPLSVGMSLLIILVVALTTFATRVVPFLIFPRGRRYRMWSSIWEGC